MDWQTFSALLHLLKWILLMNNNNADIGALNSLICIISSNIFFPLSIFGVKLIVCKAFLLSYLNCICTYIILLENYVYYFFFKK